MCGNGCKNFHISVIYIMLMPTMVEKTPSGAMRDCVYGVGGSVAKCGVHILTCNTLGWWRR